MVAGEDIRKFFLLEKELNNFQFAGVAAECCCCHSKIVLSWETDALRFSKHLWRRRICFKEIVFSTRLGLIFFLNSNKASQILQVGCHLGSEKIVVNREELAAITGLNASSSSNLATHSQTVCRAMEQLASLSSLNYLNLGGIDLKKAAAYWLLTVNTLPSLLELHMPNCQLSNLSLYLPFLNFTSLSVLHLSNNGFDSTIPHLLFNLSSLVYLDLNSNSLQGGLPDAFQNSTSLQLLDLSKNLNIEGKLLRTLGNLCYLRTLILSVNKLSGEITEFLDGLSACSYSTLENLDLGFNKLTRNLPDSLGHLKNLRYLQLWSNSFRGSIP
ncbi:Leucine-rich repeat receptor-like protein kinase PXL1 [Vitis vinifera]|uniref:Leucine-rich repeat receptor-like protein kinase PXL1 n=1 Tax=Vitis vinifera TaxID=29760 RepID=A0A438H7P5_VITVI|nr:Leucine-rich repeat receptor-like protein kinase PXL1 [Vitis vinifera]